MDLKKTKWSAPFKNSLARTLQLSIFTDFVNIELSLSLSTQWF